jgi:signal peptidase I
VLGAGVAIAANATGFHVTRVASSSMSPAIDRGDWTLVRDLEGNDRHSVGRRDIVLFRFPLGTSGRAVKRVVAVEGDRVAIAERSVTVDGHVIPVGGAPSEAAARRRIEIVPAGHVFLLGDNAADSIDSRSLGAVPETEVVGRVLFVLPKRMLLVLLGVAAAIVVGVIVARRRPRSPAHRGR